MIVYKAVNKVNNKIYVGQTKHSLETRRLQHLRKAHSGVNTHFYEAIRKYGDDAFEFSVICTANSKEDLNILETYYIQKYNSIKTGYNMVDGGDNNIMCVQDVYLKHKKRMQSDETRNKLSRTMKQKIADGNFFTPEHRARLSESAKGNHNFGSGDTRSIGCYCEDSNGNIKHFHSYRDAWKWWRNQTNPFDSKAECVYQRKIKQSIATGYYTYKHFKYEYPKWFREECDVHEKVTDQN